MKDLYIISHEGNTIMLESLVVRSNGNVLEDMGNILLEDCSFDEIPSSTIMCLPDEEVSIQMEWYSANARKGFKTDLKVSPLTDFKIVTIGVVQTGRCILWQGASEKNVLVTYKQAEERRISLDDITTWNPFITYALFSSECVKHLSWQTHKQFDDNYMQQFCYRYVPLFQHYDEDGGGWRKYGDGEAAAMPQLDYIEEALSDGTHDRLRDGSLLGHHMGGKPRRLCVAWHVGKRSYTAWLWFDTVALHEAFTRFYGVHPDTRADLIMRIDCSKDKYELSLYRQGLREPQPISPGAWQMIVFRNGFECHRSDNYSQPSGAWGWQ